MSGTFVSVGNGTQSFARLLDEVARVAAELPQPVVVQHGRTPFEAPTGVEAFDFTDEAGFNERIDACSLFISHGGGGSIFTAIRRGKMPVVVPRLHRYGEHVDDHQTYLAEELMRQGKIEVCLDVENLLDAAQRVLGEQALSVEPHNNREAIAIVAETVRGYAPSSTDMILLVTPSGGHLTEMRALATAYNGYRHHFVINTPIADDPRMVGRTTLLTLSQRDWKFVFNLIEAWKIIRLHKPRVILATGGSISFPFILFGKILGIRSIFIETVGKVVVPTLSGRLCYPLASDFFYQWPYLTKFFPRGRFIGLLL